MAKFELENVVLMIFLTFLNILDILLTYIGVEKSVFYEGNPIVAHWINAGNYFMPTIIKISMIFLIWFLYMKSAEKHEIAHQYMFYCFLVLCLWYCFVTLAWIQGLSVHKPIF